MQRRLVAGGSPHAALPWPSELAQDNSERLGPRDSVVLQFAGVAPLLRWIFPGNAKHPDENALARNQAAAASPLKTPLPRLERQTFVTSLIRDRRAHPPFAPHGRPLA